MEGARRAERRPGRGLRLPRLTPRAFVDLAVYSCGCGLLVGWVFPRFLTLMSVPPAIALRPGLRLACLGAGLLVGAVNYGLARVVVGARLRELIAGMRKARAALQRAAAVGDWSDCVSERCQVPVDSADELGEVAASHNLLLDAVAHARDVERAVAELTSSLASHLEFETLCQTALRELLRRTAAEGAAIAVPRAEGVRLVTRGRLPVDPLLREAAAAALAAARAGEDNPPATGGRGGGTPGSGRLHAVPLRAHGCLLGVLLTTATEAAARTEDLRLVDVLVTSLSVALSNSLMHERISSLAELDELTGLANRRAGLAALREQLERARCGDGALALLMADVDHFKVVNDRHGHQIGDHLLRHVAAVCRGTLRSGDLLVRYGGEELLAVLPGLDRHALAGAAERLRAAVAAAPLTTPDGRITVTVSVGGALYDASRAPATSSSEAAHLLIGQADRALYAAKRAGRNATRLAGPGDQADEDGAQHVGLLAAPLR